MTLALEAIKVKRNCGSFAKLNMKTCALNTEYDAQAKNLGTAAQWVPPGPLSDVRNMEEGYDDLKC